MKKVYLVSLSQHPLLTLGLTVFFGALIAYLGFLVLSVLLSLAVMILPYALALGVVAFLIRVAYVYGRRNR